MSKKLNHKDKIKTEYNNCFNHNSKFVNFNSSSKISINNNKHNSIILSSQPRISLSPERSSIAFSSPDYSSDFLNIKNILDKRYDKSNISDDGNSVSYDDNINHTSFNVKIKKEPIDSLKQSLFESNNSLKPRIEQQLNRNCDRSKIQKELKDLIHKNLISTIKKKTKSFIPIKNKFDGSSCFSLSLTNNLILNRKTKRLVKNKEDISNDVNTGKINSSYIKSENNFNNQSIKDERQKISNIIKQNIDKIQNNHLHLNENEKNLQLQVSNCYTIEKNHKSKTYLKSKLQKLKYSKMSKSNESFIDALNYTTGQFPLNLFKTVFNNKCLNQKIFIVNLLLKESINKSFSYNQSLYTSLRNVKTIYKDKILVFFIHDMYLHCEPIIKGSYKTGINNEILEIQDNLMNLDVYVLK